jgi:hypothetical protein
MELNPIQTDTGFRCCYGPHCYGNAVIKQLGKKAVVRYIFEEPDPRNPSKTLTLLGRDEEFENVSDKEARILAQKGLLKHIDGIIGF